MELPGIAQGRRRSAAAVLAASIALTAVPALASAASRPAPRLPSFSSCRALLDYAQAGALSARGTTGVPLRAGGDAAVIARPSGPVGFPGTTEAGAPDAAAPTASKDAASAPFSTTNNQEQGVDEPDLVKTDGRWVYLVADRTLRILDVSGPPPSRLVASLPLDGYGHQLLLRGDRLLVSASLDGSGPAQVAPGPDIARMPEPGAGRTQLTEVDVSDRAAPKVARAMTVDGDHLGARLSGGTARIVIGSAPDPIVPAEGQTLGRAVRATGLSRFVPRTVLRSAISGRTFRRPIAKCEQVRRPRRFSGTGLLTVMTVDLDRGLYSVDRDAVMAGAQTVYGSARSLYVASRRYVRAVESGDAIPDDEITEIHRFDAFADGVTRYRSTGTVPGFVLNQYALSEHEGRLRVATTQEPLWFPDGSGPATESTSAVSVLAEDPARPGRMTSIGRVGDLGRGERIYAVRFAGDLAYVVTFRQVDPLYVVDLSRPTAPRVRGELKITGYSAYLHPLGGDLLLGVGQDATEQGRSLGSQVSLFDVSDPARPRRLAQRLLGNGTSTAEFDPHAFLYWPATRLAVLPLTSYDEGTGRSSTGAVGLHVGRAEGITAAGRVAHVVDGTEVPIDRSLVAGGRLYTISYAGLGRSTLDTLTDESFTPFPPPPAR